MSNNLYYNISVSNRVLDTLKNLSKSPHPHGAFINLHLVQNLTTKRNLAKKLTKKDMAQIGTLTKQGGKISIGDY